MIYVSTPSETALLYVIEGSTGVHVVKVLSPGYVSIDNENCTATADGPFTGSSATIAFDQDEILEDLEVCECDYICNDDDVCCLNEVKEILFSDVLQWMKDVFVHIACTDVNPLYEGQYWSGFV